MLINGCQEGKGTPRLTEVKCPRCGEYVEVFVRMGGPVGKTGTLSVMKSAPAAMLCPVAVMKMITNTKNTRHGKV